MNMTVVLNVLGAVAQALAANSVPIATIIQSVMQARDNVAPDITNSQLFDMVMTRFERNITRNPELIQQIKDSMNIPVPPSPDDPPDAPPFDPLTPPITDNGEDSSI